MSLAGRVFLITGAARGIGLATADLALSRGARVVICDRDEAALNEAAAELGADVTALVCDVTSKQDATRVLSETLACEGRIDTLVNNAGTVSHAEALTLSEEHWHREVDVVMTGSFLMAQAAAVQWMRDNGGSIVNLGSGAAINGLPNSASYVAAKHGVVGLTKALAVDWAQYGIRVNCVCPGFTWTDLAKASIRAQPVMMKERIARIPLNRGGDPKDVAEAILYLGSDAAGFVSGQILSVDGGQSALSSGYVPPRGGGVA